MCALNIFVIYYDPKDFPGQYVARRFDGTKPTEEHFVAGTIDEVRRWAWERMRKIAPGLACRFHREANDDPAIVESWI